MTTKLTKDCPYCRGTGIKSDGPGLCEGGCGGTGRMPVTEADLRAIEEGNKEPVTADNGCCILLVKWSRGF